MQVELFVPKSSSSTLLERKRSLACFLKAGTFWYMLGRMRILNGSLREYEFWMWLNYQYMWKKACVRKIDEKPCCFKDSWENTQIGMLCDKTNNDRFAKWVIAMSFDVFYSACEMGHVLAPRTPRSLASVWWRPRPLALLRPVKSDCSKQILALQRAQQGHPQNRVLQTSTTWRVQGKDLWMWTRM